MLHFVSFGSGSSGNCSMLFTDTEAVVIDAGVGVRTLKSISRVMASLCLVQLASSLPMIMPIM